MQEIADVYARALFEAAVEHDALDRVHDQLNEFTDAVSNNRSLAVFLFSPYFSPEEKKDGLRRGIEAAEEIFINFLEALVERHRMPVIFRIRGRFEALWDEERALLPVQITSAIALDKSTVETIGKRIGEQTERTVQLSSNVDPDVLGGVVLRVGNLILDASIRSRLNQLRKQVAQA